MLHCSEGGTLEPRAPCLPCSEALRPGSHFRFRYRHKASEPPRKKQEQSLGCLAAQKHKGLRRLGQVQVPRRLISQQGPMAWIQQAFLCFRAQLRLESGSQGGSREVGVIRGRGGFQLLKPSTNIFSLFLDPFPPWCQQTLCCLCDCLCCFWKGTCWKEDL